MEHPQQRTIGEYRIFDRIGRGAMGEVFRAEDLSDGSVVALKVMATELAADPELVERFRREAVAAARLDHPGITRVLGFGVEGGQLYMAMELLDGDDLKDLIERGQTGDLGYKLDVMDQVARGMAFVHAQGFVHRDLKPANIHVKPDGCAKIMDFGLVRLEDSKMTRTGTAMGSPSYMAPELIRGMKADARSDVFALGSVFYELFSGKRAFGGRGMADVLMAVMKSQPEPLSRCAPEVPLPIARIVERCLKKDAADRYQTAGELSAAIEVAVIVYLDQSLAARQDEG